MESNPSKGRTIRYLRGGGGGVGQIPKKNSRTEKIQKKNIVHNKPIEKKIEQKLGVNFKIDFSTSFPGKFF
jgi:hypothetical protein